MSTPVIHHTEVIARGWPLQVAVAREVVMAEDLDRIISRRTTAILVYQGDDPVLRLSPKDAEWLSVALADARAAALDGLQGVAE